MTVVRVRFEAPVEQVFDYLADPVNRPEWQSSLRGVEVLTPGPVAVGMRWKDLTSARIVPILEITELDRPRRWVEAGEWRGITAVLALDFVPLLETATEVAAEFRLSGTGLWAPIAAAATLTAPPAIRSDLRRAARLLAARP